MSPPLDTIRQIWDQVRTSLWFIPALMVGASIGLALSLLALDDLTDGGMAQSIPLVFSGRPDGARSVLATIATSTIGVTGVVFSMTIVSLQLASSQFGPRLLRTFLRDRGNQVVLGTFLGTFTYCVVVLPTVDGSEEAAFVPHAAVTAAVGLAIASLAMLVYYIDHVAQSIHADAVIESVGSEIETVIDELFPDEVGEEAEIACATEQLADTSQTTSIQSAHAGYVRLVNADRLLAAAFTHDLRIRVRTLPGVFAIKGGTLAEVEHRSVFSDAARREIQKAFVLGTHRTTLQDALFAFEQATEIAMRAMSPGINDPTTAMHCIDRIGAGLAQVVTRAIPSSWREDEQGTPRLHIEPVMLDAVLEATVIPISRTAGAHLQVWKRLLAVLETAAQRSLRDADTSRLKDCAERVAKHGASELSCPADRIDLEAAAASIEVG